MAGLQSGAGRMMIDSVVWAQHINVTDTQTATSPQQMPRQCTVSGGGGKNPFNLNVFTNGICISNPTIFQPTDFWCIFQDIHNKTSADISYHFQRISLSLSL